MSEGPYRNMSYEDASNAMRRIYELLYPRKFYSYNTSLKGKQPFAEFVGARKENANDPDTYKDLGGAIGDVIAKYTPINGDISYNVGDSTPEETPPGKNGKTKVILDYHGKAILNSLLEVAELGARYISTLTTQLKAIANGTNGSTPLARGNAMANVYRSIFNSVDTVYAEKYGSETLARVKNMIDKLSSKSRTGVVAKNVNVVSSIKDYQVGQEEVISDAFDKDFIEYFIMYLEAELNFHKSIKSDFDNDTKRIRSTQKEAYVSNKGKPNDPVRFGSEKFARYIDASGCRSSCVGLCVASCSNTCFGCSDQCSGQCKNVCADCNNTCMANCGMTCQGTCDVECIGCSKNCSGGCRNECSRECGGTCTSGCHTICQGSCYGKATGFANKCGDCGTTCKGTCGNSCENTTSTNTPANDPKPKNIELVMQNRDPAITNQRALSSYKNRSESPATCTGCSSTSTTSTSLSNNQTCIGCGSNCSGMSTKSTVYNSNSTNSNCGAACSSSTSTQLKSPFSGSCGGACSSGCTNSSAGVSQQTSGSGCGGSCAAGCINNASASTKKIM